MVPRVPNVSMGPGSVLLPSFFNLETTGPARAALRLLMSPAKLTPALSLKGFHRDVSNVLQQSALGGLKAGLLKLRVWHRRSVKAEMTGRHVDSHVPVKRGQMLGKKDGKEEEWKHAQCKSNWLLCICAAHRFRCNDFVLRSKRMQENETLGG